MPRYDVILMGFSDAPRVGGTPAQALAKVFGVSLEAAERMLTNAPSIVKTGVDELDARRYHHAFSYIGADCRFREVASVPEDSLRLDLESGAFIPQNETADRPAVVAPPSFDDAEDADDADDEWANEQTQPPSQPPADAEPVDLETAADDFDDWDPWSGSGIGEFENAENAPSSPGAQSSGTGTIIDVAPDREKLLRQLEAFDAARPGRPGPAPTGESEPPALSTTEAFSTDDIGAVAPRPGESGDAPTYEARYEELFGQTPAEYVATVPEELELDYTGDHEATPDEPLDADARSDASVMPAPRKVVASRTIQGMRATEWVDELVSGAQPRTVHSLDVSGLAQDDGDHDS